MPNYYPFWVRQYMVNNPFMFPYGGKMNVFSLAAPQTLPVNGTLELLNIATGNHGVVRRIQIINEFVDLSNVYLNIAYDGNVTADISVPVNSIFAREHIDGIVGDTFDGGNFISRPYQTPFWVTTNQLGWGDDTNKSDILTFQIPYTNGIHIWLSAINGAGGAFWNNVYYQDSLPACWNRNYRFMAVRSDENVAAPTAGAGTISISGTSVTGSGTNFTSSDIGKYLVVGIIDALIVSVTDTTHLTLGSNESITGTGVAYKITPGHTWISRPAGKQGYLASVVVGLDGADSAMLETNPRINLDQDSTKDSIIWTGTEDFLSCAFYFEQLQMNNLGGVVSWNDTTYKLSAYACFADMPINYTNGITGRFPMVSTNACQCNWTSCYYELI